jgi:hypothetical protein
MKKGTQNVLLEEPSAAPAHLAAAQPVTTDTFIRAETDTYFKATVSKNGLGKFGHLRTPAPIDSQNVIRMNRDTLYSSAVFDLTAPVTITLLDTGGRYQSMQVINQDHYTKKVVAKPGRYTLAQKAVGTRYVAVVIRTGLDPADPQDIKTVNALQDEIKIKQQAVGAFEVPDWDRTSLAKLREALLVLGSRLSSEGGDMFGDKKEVDPIRHLIGTALGWGGLPRTAAVYISVTPEQNDGKVPHTLTVGDVPVDGFWSISLYNEKGFFEKNDQNAYSINDHSAKKNGDGSVTVQFGGDPRQPNFLPIMKGWNYTVRMYQPQQEVLDRSFVFPKAMPSQ